MFSRFLQISPCAGCCYKGSLIPEIESYVQLILISSYILMWWSATYPVRRPYPSIQLDMNIFHQFCCRWLHSGTSRPADSLPHKTQPGILGENQTQTLWRDLFFTYIADDRFSRQHKLTFCAVGSGPARHTWALATGWVADAAVATATGSVTSRPIETSQARCQETEKTISLPADELWSWKVKIPAFGK